VVRDEISNAELRTFLRDRLPDYMIPADFVFLESLPLNAAGKIDLRALPAATHSRNKLDVAYVAPVTPTQTAIASIWMELLDLDSVGVNDDFFDLGGHSLLASTMLFQVRDGTGVEVPLRVLFETPTVAELANHVETVKYMNCEADNDNDAKHQDREEIML
jgi:acyl carrier protein